MFRLLPWLTLPLLLSGCFHVQLMGGVAGAEVTVARLQQPGQPLSRLYSHSPASMIAWKGQAAWDAYPAYLKALWVGSVFPPGEPLRQDALYLLTARGGNALDSDANLLMNDAPIRVRGEWHAIAPGYKFGQLHNSISVLTEACYQWLRYRYPGGMPDDAQVLRELDAAAARMLEDINRDGLVNYNDVLVWNIYAGAGHYKGSMDDLRDLAMFISLDFPQAFILRASRKIVDLAPPPAPESPGLLDYLQARLAR